MSEKTKSKTGPQTQAYSEAVIAGRGCGGDIRIAIPAIITIVRQAACSVEGVTRITGSNLINNIAEFVGSRKVLDRAIQIEIRKSQLTVELSINVCYDISLPTVAANVQKNIIRQVEELTGLEVAKVNVIIREMEELTDEGNEGEDPENGRR